jgi:hypothetical protein
MRAFGVDWRAGGMCDDLLRVCKALGTDDYVRVCDVLFEYCTPSEGEIISVYCYFPVELGYYPYGEDDTTYIGSKPFSEAMAARLRRLARETNAILAWYWVEVVYMARVLQRKRRVVNPTVAVRSSRGRGYCCLPLRKVL